MTTNRNRQDTDPPQDTIAFEDAIRIARSKAPEEEKIRLLEERLVVNHYKRKIGEVVVRKVIETQTIEVPVRRERLIIEQISPEQKQLAAIDLDDLHQDVSQPVDYLSEAPQIHYMTTPAPTETGRFIPADAAQRVLQEVTEKPGYQQVNVKIVFEDASLQSIYAQWLERYLEQAGA